MTEQNQSRKFADTSAAIANETLEKGKATAERSAQVFEQSYSTSVENMRSYNLRVIDMAQANMAAAFDGARQLTAAKTPTDFIERWMSHGRKQFEVLSEQTKELTALGQKLAGESVEPIAQAVNPAFRKAS